MSEKQIMERVVRIIATTRFPFVDQKDWPDDYITITNENEKRRGVEGPKDTIYPSIIIVDGHDNVREVGEVETEKTVNEKQLPKWKLLSEKTSMGRKTKKFFLYVPEGKEGEAQRLLEGHKISYAGLRTWAIKNGNLTITPIKTPDEPKDHR